MTRIFFVRSLALVAVAFLLVDCNKEKPTKALITVVDSLGAPVSDVHVKLFANPTFPLGDPTRLDKETWTNSAGVAEFDYTDEYKQGQAGFAVLDILATKDTMAGEGIIKILEEEDNEEKVELLPVAP
jgi:hypothetical protein